MALGVLFRGVGLCVLVGVCFGWLCVARVWGGECGVFVFVVGFSSGFLLPGVPRRISTSFSSLPVL